MNHQKDDMELKDYTNNSQNKDINNANNEKESSKNEENTFSSSSSPIKKYGRKNRINQYSNINYSIYNNPLTDKKNKEKQSNELSLIIEENNNRNYRKIENSKNDEDDDNNFCLFKDKNEELIESENQKQIDEIFNKNLIEKNEKKENVSETIIIEDDQKIDEKKIMDNKNEEGNKEESKKIIKDLKKEEKGNNSKVSSKIKIDLDFLNKDEAEKESEDDFKTYIKKAYDDEEEYKIIYEFNKLPYKPKILNIDLSIFDDNSILKCISQCFFDKIEQRFILKLNFVYLSNKSNLYFDKNVDEILMEYYLAQEKNPKEYKNEEKENSKKEEYNLDNNIKIKVILKRFRIMKGYGSVVANESKTIKKKDILDGFQTIEFGEKEDLMNYANYQKVFYILSIQKIIFLKSKMPLPVKKIGIQNEGNTCYMNSIIQSLYNNPFLLKNIMMINTSSELLSRNDCMKDKDIILALQNIFYNLNTNNYSIKILEIFFAFQWKRIFWNSPQDAEEIYMQIYEIISRYNDEIKNNCEGILENTIEVKEKNYKSTHEETFFFLQLDIENNQSLKECLEYFFKNEELSGENKYQYIDNLGNKYLYNADKFYKFKKIPNILFIQLKRFQYDPNTFSFIKNNKGISFKEELDLSDYLDNNINKPIKEEYVIYCIIVHSGNSQYGHYFCYIKDFKNNCYIKFNDTNVYRAEKKEVFNHNFGGEEIDFEIKNTRKNGDNNKYEVKDIKKEINRNAYIFIYVKKNKINELFLNEEDLIKTLFEEFSRNKKQKDKKQKYINKNNNKEEEEYLQYIGGKNDKKKRNQKKINWNIKFTNRKMRNTMLPNENKNIQNSNRNINLTKNNITPITCHINMNENFDFTNTLNEMEKCNENLKNFENISKYYKRKTMLNKDNNKINSERRISLMNYLSIEINNFKTNYYLIDDLKKRIKGIFLFQDYSKIKVKDVPDKIREEFNNQVIEKEDKEIFEKIVRSNGYKLVLINSIGIFIKFLEDENEDVLPLLQNENFIDKKYNKHLCLYNFTNLDKKTKINNIIIINFISNSLLDLIISKNEDIYDNFNFENINVPAFIINEEINNKNNLIDRLKDIYIDYFRNKVKKNINFKIYRINDNDIFNLDILKINLTELNDDNNILNILTESNQLTYLNLLVGI